MPHTHYGTGRGKRRGGLKQTPGEPGPALRRDIDRKRRGGLKQTPGEPGPALRRDIDRKRGDGLFRTGVGQMGRSTSFHLPTPPRRIGKATDLPTAPDAGAIQTLGERIAARRAMRALEEKMRKRR